MRVHVETNSLIMSKGRVAEIGEYKNLQKGKLGFCCQKTEL